MDKLNRELVMNVTVVSAVLTLALAGIGAFTSANQSETDIGVDAALYFMLYMLILYIYHGTLSIISYILGRLIGHLALRLIAFHAVGMLLLAAAWHYTRESGIIAAYVSIIVLTLTSIVAHRKWEQHKT